MGHGHILIVDPDERLVPSLVGLLRHAGFTVSCAREGRQALSSIREHIPDLILLDIWLPGMDGIEFLHALRATGHATAVIVTSGHGNIQIAVQATRLGAFDFIEKPFAPDALLRTIHQALAGDAQPPVKAWRHTVAGHQAGGPPEARPEPPSPSRQRTLRQSVVLHGQGLQTGLKTGLILSPLPPHSGIVFRDITTGERLPASIACVESTAFCTSLRKDSMAVRTVEHLMSVLHAYRICNLLIKISHEVPIMDGSATDFCELIEAGGIVDQEALAEEFVVDRCYHIGDLESGAKSIAVEPYAGFRITYRLDYPPPLGVQEFTYEHVDETSYRQEVAPARTFGFVKDVENLHELGLVAGGRLNNVILLDGEKIVNSTQLRFADECARHKVLDLMGDLYLLGKPLRGYVRANMTGHTENAALVRQLHEAMAPCA